MLSDSSREYTKREQDARTLELFEQIKRQADEISTSEGSIQLFKNLSNPTNLTNPQIIGLRRANEENSKSKIPSSSNISKEKINKTKIKNILKTKSHRNIKKDFLFFREKNKKYLFENSNTSKTNDKKKITKKEIQKEKEKEKNLFKNRIERNALSSSKMKEQNHTLIPKKVFLDPIWDKLQTARTFHKIDKQIEVNMRKYTNKLNYIDNSKEISTLKYYLQNKTERYKRLKKITDSELLIVEKNLEKIENSKNFIENNYYTNFVQYLIFLNRTIEKETNILSEYSINIYKLKNDINKLKNMIKKLIEQKQITLLWISLQIQINERLIKFPDYYFELLEEYDNFKIFNNKKINKFNSYTSSSTSTILFDEKEIEKSGQEEIKERILNYKNNPIYDTADEFLNQYDILENKWLKDSDYHQNLLIEIGNLKNEFLSSKDLLKKGKNNEILIKLNYVKNLNKELKAELEKLKLEKKISKGKTLIQNKKNKFSKSSLSTLDITKNTFKHNILYKHKKYSTPKDKIFNNSFFNSFSNTNSNIYYLIMELFSMVKENHFVKYDNNDSQKNNNPLIDILNYIEKVINLLLEEKGKYKKDEILCEKYEKIEDEVIKENKTIKYLNVLKMRDFKQKEKIKQMAEKMNKGVYHPTRQIDYSFVNLNKTDRYKESKIIKPEKSNIPPSFEDFMYDL